MKRIGIVGAGFIAEKHAEGIKQFNNIKLVGITDIVAKKCKDMASKFGVKPYSSFAELLSDDTIDIIDICVPSHLHLDFSLQTIRAGKPFLLEKPIAMNSSDASMIVNSAKEAGIEMMVGQSLRFKPEYMYAKELITSGAIGEVKQIYTARLGQRPSWGEWYADSKKSGGVLFNIMLHDIDYLYSLFGDVKRVYAVGTKCDNGGYEDIMATLTFSSGQQAIIDGSSMMTPGFPFTMKLRVDGTLGTIEYSFVGGENTEICRTSELHLYTISQEPKLIACQKFSNHGKELSYFADCLERGIKPTLCMPEESVRVIEILESIMRSINKQKVVLSAAPKSLN